MNMGNSIIDFNEKKGFICDMDGVIYHGNQILPGVPEFIQWLHDEKNPSFHVRYGKPGRTGLILPRQGRSGCQSVKGFDRGSQRSAHGQARFSRRLPS